MTGGTLAGSNRRVLLNLWEAGVENEIPCAGRGLDRLSVYGGSVEAQVSSQSPIFQSLTACFNDAIQRNVVGKEEESVTFQRNGQVAKSFFELLGQLDVETKDVADKAGTERYRFFGQSGCYHRIEVPESNF